MRSRFWYLALTITGLVAACAVRIVDPAPVERLRLLAFDTYQRMAPRIYDPALAVRIVDIDDDSLARIGQWPWPRSLLAGLTRSLDDHGAAAIGFDIVFAEPDRLSAAELLKRMPNDPVLQAIAARLGELPSGDADLAEAIGRAPVVLGFFGIPEANGTSPVQRAGLAAAGDDPKQFVPAFNGAVVSLDMLQDKSKGSGSLNWIPLHDQIVRRLPLLVRVGDQLFPSFAAEALRVGQGASTYVVKASGASAETAFGAKTGLTHVRIGQVTVPTDAFGQMWLRLTKSDSRRRIPAWRVLEGQVDRQDIDGRIVLIGTSAAGLFDLRTTALDDSVPAVEIHAQAIEQMLSGSYLERPDFATGLELITLVISGILVAVAVYTTGALWSAALGTAVIAAGILGSWTAYTGLGWQFDPVYPTFALTLLYLAATVYRYLRTEVERNRVRNAFSHYMAPAQVKELAAHPEKLKLGGESRTITLLFSDVRGFTAIAERLDAQQLTQFLNRLLTPLSNTILSNRGTIDKYIGDAIMAFWNAPLDDAAHARNACRSALGMLQNLARLNRAWKAEAAAHGARHVPVRIGIGLNTAECCVGNLGSERRFDYSAVGDGVNLASRLERQSQTYGVPIVVGEATVQAAADFAFLEVDLLNVMGKKESVHVFALLGDEEHRQSASFRELSQRHGAMLSAYRSRRFEEARTLLEPARAAGGGQLSALYDLYAERIAGFLVTPPPADWDGRAIAETK